MFSLVGVFQTKHKKGLKATSYGEALLSLVKWSKKGPLIKWWKEKDCTFEQFIIDMDQTFQDSKP